MISRLQGMLIAKTPPTILLDVNGVGYEIDIPMTTLYDLPELGERVVLHTHLAIREDAQQLFGFLQESDRHLFRELIKVNGVGGRTALGILSGITAPDLVECIRNENITLLCKIPGIGKKTAERLIIEMRDRLKVWGQTHAQTGTTNLNTPHAEVPQSSKDEAIAALVALGYRPADSQKAVEKCYNAELSSEDLIRQSLRNML